MTTDAATPAGFWERVEQVAEKVLARYIRSGFLRNASIGEGGTLTLRGGIFRLIYGAFNLFYVGPISPSLPDGTPQQGFRLRRADGTIALETRDAFPDPDGTLNQALTWYDRFGNAVFADDTDSGQGIARPYVPFTFYLARNGDWPTVSSGTFSTVYRAVGPKQQPQLYVEAWANAPDPGAVGEVRVLVNNILWDTVKASVPGFATGMVFGPVSVPGSHMSTVTIEVQARLASGTGVVQVGVQRIEGRQN